MVDKMSVDFDESKNLRHRVSRIEGELGDIKISVSQTNVTLNAQSRILDHYGSVLDRISEKINNKPPINYSAYISFIALLIVVTASILFPIRELIYDNKQKIKQIEELMTIRTADRWNRVEQQRFEDKLEKRLDKLESK